MRTLSSILIFLVVFTWSGPVFAEYLQGTLVRIDRDRGEVEILLSATGLCSLEESEESTSLEKAGDPVKQRSIVVKAVWLPRCLAAGDQVYARGEFASENQDIFEAEDVFPCRRRGGHDPTGVRSRFHHHRRQMMRQMERGPNE